MAPDTNRHGIQALRSLAHIGYLGFTMAIPIGIGAWLGSTLDRRFGGNGIYTVCCIFLGVAAGVLGAYRTISQALSQQKTSTLSNETNHDGNEPDSTRNPRP